MSTLFVCNKINSLKNDELVELNDINLSSTVGTLCSVIADKLGLRYENDDPTFELICFGRQLKTEKQLSTFGVRNGCTLYLFPLESKGTQKGKKPKFEGSQAEVSQMVIALRTALMNSSFRSMLQKLYEKDLRDNLFACTPALRNDPVAVGILQDPDLLALLTDPESSEKILDKHPCLLEAATHLAAAFHEDSLTSNTNSTDTGAMNFSIPSSNAYSLDDLSDDDDLAGGVDAAPPDGQAVMSPRTADSFQQLLQQHSLLTRLQQPGASTSASSTNNLAANQRITADMLFQAIQSTQASTSAAAPSDEPTTPVNPPQRQARDWSREIRQINEFGIVDNAGIIQALELTGGDVQAAINILLDPHL